jgi:hypothetical protein
MADPQAWAPEVRGRGDISKRGSTRCIAVRTQSGNILNINKFSAQNFEEMNLKSRWY